MDIVGVHSIASIASRIAADVSDGLDLHVQVDE
jgi:hypothetical protein